MAEIYQIFTSVDETYVMLDTEVTTNRIIDVFENKDISNGIVAIIHNDQKDEIVDVIMETNLFDESDLIGVARNFSVILFE